MHGKMGLASVLLPHLSDVVIGEPIRLDVPRRNVSVVFASALGVVDSMLAELPCDRLHVGSDRCPG